MPDNRDYIVANGEFRDLIRTVAVLATKVDNLEATMNQMGPWQCPVHSEQIATMKGDIREVKGQIAGDRKITVGVSAITASILLALKWAFIK
jgi:predicted fused transcriptional regulator/phosphomethylpyrimidine kinase